MAENHPRALTLPPYATRVHAFKIAPVEAFHRRKPYCRAGKESTHPYPAARAVIKLDNATAQPPMFKKILVVCIGNICRSPTAEALLISRLGHRGYEVSSAGIHALVEKPMDGKALEVLREHQCDHPNHRARQLTRDLLSQADLILTMEKGHVESIARMAPEVRGKTFLLGKWVGEKEISDPYRQDKAAFEHVYQLMAQSVDSWSQKLK
jgi:protein-tyrosine phosphatase